MFMPVSKNNWINEDMRPKELPKPSGARQIPSTPTATASIPSQLAEKESLATEASKKNKNMRSGASSVRAHIITPILGANPAGSPRAAREPVPKAAAWAPSRNLARKN
jgi:hypothetical protein